MGMPSAATTQFSRPSPMGMLPMARVQTLTPPVMARSSPKTSTPPLSVCSLTTMPLRPLDAFAVMAPRGAVGPSICTTHWPWELAICSPRVFVRSARLTLAASKAAEVESSRGSPGAAVRSTAWKYPAGMVSFELEVSQPPDLGPVVPIAQYLEAAHAADAHDLRGEHHETPREMS